MGVSINIEGGLDDKFVAGQDVVGVAVVNLSSKHGIELRTIMARFKGKAKVKWSETYNKGDIPLTKRYKKKESYFDTKIELYLAGQKQDGESSVVLKCGRHEFPIRFSLPENIPSSFVSSTGSVSYSVEIIIDRVRSMNDTSKKPFSVVSPLDLNSLSSEFEPVVARGSRDFHSFFLNCGTLSATVSLEKKGFVQGEAIQIQTDINNQSNVTIKELRIELKQKCIFNGGNKTKTKENTLQTNVLQLNLGAKEKLNNSARPLEVPENLVPSGLNHCSIIDIEYFIEFKIVPSGVHNELILRVPVIFGHIPLDLEAKNQNIPVQGPKAFSQEEDEDLPPPSYFEATEG